MRIRSAVPSLLVAVALAACGSDDGTTTSAGAPEASACERITAFAEMVQDVGITYDYEPSASPASLATRADAVFAGFLTGEFAHRDAAPDEPVTSWVGFEIEVTEIVHGDVAVGDQVVVALAYNPAMRRAADYERAIVADAEVVVFAHELSDPPAELFLGVEGFATACDGGAPMGRLGGTAAWTAATTLADLVDAAASPTDRVEVVLWHCGIDTISVDGRTWEVPNDEEPFDGTNAPDSFAGIGTIERVGPDELHYTDDSGTELRFVPDDGTEPPCA